MPALPRALAASAAILVLLLPAAAEAARPLQVSVARSAYGIPHVRAGDFGSLAYGYARAIAEDDLCVLADMYLTVDGRRSRFFGPDARVQFGGNESSATNLQSDLFATRIKDERVVERLLEQAGPSGLRPEIRDGVRGFVAGYNAHLRDIGGPDGITDPACKGAPWVRPITEIDVYRRFHQLALLASSGVAVEGIASAQPPTPATGDGARGALDARRLAPGEVDRRLGGLGSNAIALGRAATEHDGGMLLGNPHFPWYGSERFYASHLTIPGRADVMGGSLLGVPLINIGFTRTMAWSHTVSTARRFAVYQLTLVPGDPTAYVVDGQIRRMRPSKVTVEVRRPDGTIAPVTRTLWTSDRGPILTSILGLPIFPWTPATAFALDDANDENFGRLLNHFLEVNLAGSVDEVDAVLRRHQGIPWVNTIAADTTGKAYYADIGSVVHVTDEQLAACSTALGIATDAAQRLPILDGSRSACAPGSDPDAVVPGILGLGRLPSLTREDATSNMNDSHWLTNPAQPLEGFDRIVGEERTARSLRTRAGLRLIAERLSGRDGLPGTRFTLDQLQQLAFGNRVESAILWKDELAAFCRTLPAAVTTGGPVALGDACDVLAAWNGRDDLDAPGALLFRRFAVRAVGTLPLQPFPVTPFLRPFDPADPVATPSGLNVANPLVSEALGQAVRDLRGAGLELDATLRDGQAVTRAGERIPLQGGLSEAGVFNVLTPVWDPKRGYTDVVHGSSYIQAVELRRGSTCPRARTLVTYSQSADPTSPHHTDQTKLFSQKRWVTPPFCPKAVAKLPRTVMAEQPGARTLTAASWHEARGRARPALEVVLARPARVVVTAGARRIVRRLAAGRHVLRPRVARGERTARVAAGGEVLSLRVRQR